MEEEEEEVSSNEANSPPSSELGDIHEGMYVLDCFI